MLLGEITADNLRDTYYMKLEEIAMYFRITLETVNIAICVVDNNGTILYWNRSAEMLYGIKAEDFIGHHMSTYFSNVLLSKALHGEVIDSVEHQPREGTHIIISASPIILNGKIIGAVSIDQDVTEYINLTNQLMKVRNQVTYLQEEINKMQEDRFSNFNIIAKSKNMIDLINLAKKISKTDATVLIQGESGTGKELIAHTIHMASPRKESPFIVVDCSTIPHHLLESELFGYEPGAFTGASKNGKIGKFQLAEGGTLLLDEIGELPFEMQAKLLRVLQEKTFYRVGGVKPITINVRVLAATNRNLKQMIKDKTFREDLYYRINVVSLSIPELKDRKEDIMLLFDDFIKTYSNKYKKHIMRINADVIEVFLNYKWPGNVRELKNITERLIILSEDGIIKTEYLPEHMVQEVSLKGNSKTKNIPNQSTSVTPLSEVIKEAEKHAIQLALEKANQNRSLAAKLLDIPRSTLYFKINELELDKKES